MPGGLQRTDGRTKAGRSVKPSPSVTVPRGASIRVLGPGGQVVPYFVADIIGRRVLLRWGASGVRYEFGLPGGTCRELPGWTVAPDDVARLVAHCQTRYVSVKCVPSRGVRAHRPRPAAPGQRSLF